MTTFARKGPASIASHSKGVLRKSVSSPAAAAALNDVHELVSRLESRQPHAAASSGGLDPLQHSSSSSPRQYVVHEDLVVDIRASDDSGAASASNSAHSQRATPVSGAWGGPGARRQQDANSGRASLLGATSGKGKGEAGGGGRRPQEPVLAPVGGLAPRLRCGACRTGQEDADDGVVAGRSQDV